MAVLAKYSVNEGQLRALIWDPGEGVTQDIERRARNVQQAAKREAPVRSGRLRSSIEVRRANDSDSPAQEIYVGVDYGVYVHEGTGIYAGRGMIRPKRAKFLAWQEGGRWIFARQVRGQRANNFLERALSAASD